MSLEQPTPEAIIADYMITIEQLGDGGRISARQIITLLEEDGFVIVPREATEAMKKAADDAGSLFPGTLESDMAGMANIWRVMIAAAPRP